MITKLSSLTVIMCALALSCNVQNQGADSHSSQNSLDWAGTYFGILPCASCEGIETELTLTKELKYVLVTSYIGEGENTFTKEGSFSWSGNAIRLDGFKKGEAPSMYKVEEGQIRQLDLKGREIEGELAGRSILAKCGNEEVEDKRWQLVEVFGKPVTGEATTHYLVFHSKDNKLEAKAGCNVMLSEYRIRNKFQLRITPGISTLMACPDDLEDNLKKVLSEADNITFSTTALSLNKGRMAPLARFELAAE